MTQRAYSFKKKVLIKYLHTMATLNCTFYCFITSLCVFPVIAFRCASDENMSSVEATKDYLINSNSFEYI